jgi:hypothetical protein
VTFDQLVAVVVHNFNHLRHSIAGTVAVALPGPLREMLEHRHDEDIV